MAWEPNFIEDGDAATAVRINNIMDDAEAWVNDIGPEGLRRGTFNHFFPPPTGVMPTTGNYRVYESSSLARYTKGVFLGSVTYTTYGADGGSSNAGDLGAGDRAVIGHVTARGIANPCQVSMPGGGFKIGMGNGDRVAGILCTLNVEVSDFNKGAGVPTYMWIMVCLQFRLNGAGTWYTIDSSERFCSMFDRKLTHSSTDEKVEIDIPVAAFITEAMVEAVGTAATDKVSDVRAVCSMYSNTDNTSWFDLGQWFLSAIPVHADVTEV